VRLCSWCFVAVAYRAQIPSPFVAYVAANKALHSFLNNKFGFCSSCWSWLYFFDVGVWCCRSCRCRCFVVVVVVVVVVVAVVCCLCAQSLKDENENAPH